VERLIGLVRRENLGRTLLWKSLYLERKLASYRDVYKDSRVYSWLGGKIFTEVSHDYERLLADVIISWSRPHCGGFYTLPFAA
jgi:hypothetical protein